MSLFGLLPQSASNVGTRSATTMGTPPNSGPSGYQPEPIGLLGMLGVKGKTRDVLGKLGDAFLVQAGHSPTYGPAKQQNSINEALYSFADDPAGAIRKLYEIDPTRARKVETDFQKQQADALKAQVELDGERLDQQVDEYDLWNKVIDNVGGFMSGANETTYGPMREQGIALAKAQGFDLSPYLPEAYDQNSIQNFGNLAVNPKDIRSQKSLDAYRQAQIEQGFGRLDVSQQNANTSAGRAAETRRANSVSERQRDQAIGIDAYQARTSRQRANQSGERTSRTRQRSENKPVGTVSLSQVPANARFGKLNGKRVAQVNGKVYYVK